MNNITPIRPPPEADDLQLQCGDCDNRAFTIMIDADNFYAFICTACYGVAGVVAGEAVILEDGADDDDQ